MNKIQILQEPGYIYDLDFVFSLKFNTKMYIDKLPNDDRKEQNIKYFNDILDKFGDIPDDLYVFFHAIETERTFLTACYFYPYRNQFSTTYDFKFLQKEISDHSKLVKNLIKFYFHDLDDESVERCATSLNEMFSHIKNSKYSEQEKNRLYEFFIEPSRYIQLLLYELVQKEAILSGYYKENYQKIISIYNQTTFESLSEQLKDYENLIVDKQTDILYISYCLLNKFCVSLWFVKSGYLPLLGYEYMYILGYVKESQSVPELYNFATALCEESRVKILNFLIDREEITCKDLEKEFSFSGSTAYHHITIMTKTGLVQTRNEGKTVLYSLNKKCVVAIIHELNKLLSKKGK